MYAVGIKRSAYGTAIEAPMTLVDDKATADALKNLLDASGATKAYVLEVPIWPAMRAQED